MKRGTALLTTILCVIAIVLVYGNSWRIGMALALVAGCVHIWIGEICTAIRESSTRPTTGREG